MKVARSKLVLLILLVLCTHILVIALSIADSKITFQKYAMMHDGAEYLDYARHIKNMELANLSLRTTRLYPGYPLLISAFDIFLPPEFAALFISVLGSVMATIMFYLIFKDYWLTLYFTIFTPSWLYYSSLAMSESIFLGLCLVGLWLFKENKLYLCALVLAFASIIRPVGFILFVALAIVGFFYYKRGELFYFILTYLAIPVIWLVISALTWGSVSKSIDTYLLLDFAIPFSAFVKYTASPDVSIFKKLYIWGTIILCIVGFYNILKEWTRNKGKLPSVLLIWSGVSIVFYLFMTSRWAFGCLDRFVIAFLPATMYGLRSYFPRKLWGLILLGLISILISLYWNHNMVVALQRKGIF